MKRFLSAILLGAFLFASNPVPADAAVVRVVKVKKVVKVKVKVKKIGRRVRR